MLRKISLILGCLMLPLFVQADEEERTVSAAKAATGAARNLISNFSVQSFGPTMPIFRYRLGLNDSDLRGTAAGDEEEQDSEDEFVTRSFSVTPTVANIDNQITPILTKGQVKLMILGVEWFDELELTAKGVTFTVDNTDITSTERVPPAADVSSSVDGSGYTIAPYFVRQTESGGIHDVSFGIGQNSLKTKSTSATASLKSNRRFISTGYSSAEALSDTLLVQYKFTASHTQDSVPAYSQSDGTAVPKSGTKHTQMMAEARFTKDMDGIAPFLGLSLIWNSFSASGGSGPAPREYDYTPLLSVGFNFSNDLLYGMLAMQGERDKKTTQFYIGFRF
jgi:hypothetical protein